LEEAFVNSFGETFSHLFEAKDVPPEKVCGRNTLRDGIVMRRLGDVSLD
jgi:hypothetical protein